MKALQPSQLGPLSLKNRFFMAPVKTAMCAPGGAVTPQILRYYERMARGGSAAIILEPCAVSAGGREHPKQLALHDDAHVGPLQSIVDTVHGNGALVGVHLNHAGRAANPKVIGQPPMAPSPGVCPTTGAEAKALEEPQIEAIIGDFGRAARRAREAGADFVEVQCGHGYLVAQFFSERTNQRQDRWGGSEENRLRFARGVLEAVQANAGALPLLVRISSSEFVPDGLTPDRLSPLLDAIAQAGATAIHVGNGNACDSPPWYYSHMAMPEEKQVEALQAVRAATSLPLIAAGRMGHVERLGQVMEMGYDFVALGRALIADPEFVHKLVQGRAEEILECGACLDGCLRAVKGGRPIHCIVNPDLTPAPRPAPAQTRHVLVVGAGPAGIAASLRLAGESHRVELYERSEHIGGQFNYAAVAPMKRQMARMMPGLQQQLAHSTVELHLSTAATAELVAQRNPDQVVIATGAVQHVPSIDDLDSQDWLTSLDYYAGLRPVTGQRVLIVGAGMIGLETAALLAGEGREVVCVDPLAEVAGEMEPIFRKILTTRLSAMPNVEIRTATLVEGFDESAVRIEHEGRKETLPPFDQVVIAAGTRSENGLAAELRDWGGEVVVIGDAHQVANIEHAFADGLRVE